MKIPNQPPPWFDDEYLTLRKELRHVKSIAQKSNLAKDWQAFKGTRNKLNNLAKKLKKDYFESSIRDAGTNSRKLWKTVKTVLPGSQHKPIHSVKVDDNVTSNGDDIANEFNAFFSNIGKKLADAIPVTTNQANHADGTVPGKNRFQFSRITAEEVSNILGDLDGGKATGLDNISPRLLKIGHNHLARPLAYIMNLSFSSGIVPSAWKISRVSPIFKEGDPTDTSNYRPISVIPACMKVFEKIVHNQLYKFIEHHQILSLNQSGFRPKHSTQTCLVEVCDYLLNNMSEGYFTGAVFLDLKKAFDTVHHEVLLNKLVSIGVCGLELEWFSSYLSDRFQVTRVNDHLSSKASVTFGVPQGSILGPLLFTIYINDLPTILKSVDCRVFLYADDTAIFVRGKTVDIINRILNSKFSHVARWLQTNYLTLNVKKTKSMLLGTQQKLRRTKGKLNIKMRGEPVEQVDQFKYLGIWLDPSLTWSVNTEKLVSKVNKRIGLLRRVRNVLPTKTLKMLYKSLIIHDFDYCDVVWGNAGNTLLSRLDVLQKTAGKVILGLPRRFPTDVLLKKLEWGKLSDRRTTHLNIMVYKSLTCSLPRNLCNIFNTVSSSHNYDTRAGSQGNLTLPLCRNTSDGRKFTFRGATAFNNLPAAAKSPIPAKLSFFKRIIA